MSELSMVCPGCGEHEVELMVAGSGPVGADGVPLGAEGFYRCARCGWAGNEQALRGGVEYTLEREIRECFREDQRRGEPGGGSNSAPPRKSKRVEAYRAFKLDQETSAPWGDRDPRTITVEPRDLTFPPIKLTQSEDALILGAIAISGMTKSKWARAALIRQAREEAERYRATVSE